MQPYHPLLDVGQNVIPVLPRDAPYFFELDIQFRKLQTIHKEVNHVPVRIQTQVLNDEIWTAECYYTLPAPLAAPVVEFKRRINSALRRDFLAEARYQGPLVEEYTILLMTGLDTRPEDFVAANSGVLAQLLRFSYRPLDPVMTGEILHSRTSYSVDDLTIVDWEGALVISPGADYQTEIDLFKIGNYHLLKYRMVDAQIDMQLQQLRVLVGKSFSWFSNRRETLQKAVDSRLSLMLDFEHTDQSILLIGEWYPAQLYRIIFDEFYIDEWKVIVTDKLENLSSIAEVIQQDLTISWSRLLDLVQLIGWMVLLIGSIILFLRDINTPR
jgi:hypothetical protein